MFEIERLSEKLKLIEALYAGAATGGERAAADSARQRIRDRIRQHEAADPPVEFSFKLNNAWSRKLFVALLRRYDLKPYRYHRQRHTTVMARVSRGFVNNTLWPEFVELDKELTSHLDSVAEKIINESVFEDSSDIEEIAMLPDSSGNSFVIN